MRKFLLTGPKFSGEFALIYNADGLLVQVDMSSATLSAGQRKLLLAAAPVLVSAIDGAYEGKLTIVEGSFDVTFEMFWQRYGMKRNKMGAEKLWAKLRKTEQVEAWHRIAAYDKYCQKNATWYQRMYPDTWLRNRQWESEWETL